MKRIFFAVVALFAFTTIGMAQVGNGYENAAGVRVGLHSTYELSYQRYVLPSGRIEGTAGISKYEGSNDFSFQAIYQWMIQIPTNNAGTLQWYPGAGIEIGNWGSGHMTNFKSHKGLSMGISPQIGLEYTFGRVPILVSLDYRPVFYFMQENKATWYGFALGVRYCF